MSAGPWSSSELNLMHFSDLHYSSAIVLMGHFSFPASISLTAARHRSSSQSEEKHLKLKEPWALGHKHSVLLHKHWRKLTASFLRWSGNLFKSSRRFSGHIQRMDLRIEIRSLLCEKPRYTQKHFTTCVIYKNNTNGLHWKRTTSTSCT